jgi:hypothetical protein
MANVSAQLTSVMDGVEEQIPQELAHRTFPIGSSIDHELGATATTQPIDFELAPTPSQFRRAKRLKVNSDLAWTMRQSSSL